MPDIWMDVDAAVVVPMNILPILDDTDFKSIETGLVYNSGGIVVNWNFVTTAGAMTITAITPTTGGNYDIGEPTADKGMYTIEIPASGGASANNSVEGFGWITGIATGMLPWRGPTIGFRDAALNNALIDSAWSATRGLAGTALPAAAADAAGGLPISDAGALDLDTYIKRLEAAFTAAIAARLDENISAAKKISTGTGAGQLDITSGVVKANMAQILGTALTETAGYLAAGFKKLFNVATPVLTAASVNQTGDSFARLGSPAGASHAADVAAVKAETANIVADTNELQTDWHDGGRLDLLLDGASAPSAATVADAVWNEAIADHAGAGSTGLALAGASAPSAASVADAVWDEALHTAHEVAGSASVLLQSAGAAADPLATAVPGAYAAGTAGHILGDLAGQSLELVVTSPVAVGGESIELVQGDDYNNSDGRALEWSSALWPDLTSGSVAFHLEDSGGLFTKAGSLVTTGSGVTQTVRVELTAAESATFDTGMAKFDVEATLASSRKITLAIGTCNVLVGAA